MATRKASAKAKAEAAVAEVDEAAEPKTVEWEGLTFELPALLPETTLLDMAVVETSPNPTASFKMLRRILGEAQFAMVTNKVEQQDNVTLASVGELTDLIFEQYGVSEGESQASQDS